jgi:hypothetical protein
MHRTSQRMTSFLSFLSLLYGQSNHHSSLIDTGGPLTVVRSCFLWNAVGVSPVVSYHADSITATDNYAEVSRGGRCPLMSHFQTLEQYETDSPFCYDMDETTCLADVTLAPVIAPTLAPTVLPTSVPTVAPSTSHPTTWGPSLSPTVAPTRSLALEGTSGPTPELTSRPSLSVPLSPSEPTSDADQGKIGLIAYMILLCTVLWNL